MSHSSDFYIEKNQPLYYFTGRVRAFWKDLIFFSDARNVAVIEIHDVYINGKQASSRDLTYLEEMVEKSDWKGAPEFHSYVSEYPCDSPRPWPYQLSGKTLWKAKCAWLGLFPDSIKNVNMNNIVHMPISYYTGTVMELYNDKILFGDMRNSVMVTSDNFYFNGKRGFIKNIYGNSTKSSHVIHAYIIRLEVLADIRLGGPEPDLPTWPKEHFSSDMWVAKYAWYGDVPDVVKDQVGRYYAIRLNQWGNIQSIPWKSGNGWQDLTSENSWKKKSISEDKQRAPGKQVGSCQPLVPTEQPAGFMRGSLLLADDKQGLMTSYVDVIAFSKDNFYVNGQKFRHNYDLDLFFQNRRVPLTAWVIPFNKPKVVFNINVVWYAVCVWYGSPPRELEYIKCTSEKLGDNLVETTAPVSLTHFLGNVHSLSFASGVLMSRAGLHQAVKISFKRKVVYLYGSRFHSSCSLLDKQQVLESNIWSVLAYPVWTEQATGIPHYQALVMWYYDDQHSMNMFKITSEFVDLIPTLQNAELDETKDDLREEKLVQHLSGCTVKVSEDYGIIQSGSALVDAAYLYFRKEVLFIDGELFPKNASLQSIGQGRQCSMQAKTIPPKKIDGHQVTMEATLVWIGRKPSFESSGECTPSDCSGSPAHVQNTDSNDDREPFVAKMETESCSRPDKVLHAAEGVMVGSVFIVDEHNGLIICSDIIVSFSSDIFYVNGEKFKSKYGSLDEFCSDRKITVRAMIATLKKPKALLNCFVMCEAVCVWIGQEPSNLSLLQKEHVCEKNKTSDISKISHKSLLYFKGRMTPASKDVTLLASTTPEGTSKIIFSKENMFANGIAVHQDDIFEQCKRNSQNWSVLALPLPPRDIVGHSVCYKAVAVWDMSNHHKMRKALKSIACQINELHDKQEHCTNLKQNEVSAAGNLSKATPDTLEALIRTWQLEDPNKEEKLVQVSPQLNDPSVLVSHITKESSESESDSASVDLAYSISVKEFCGKHITGYIIKKFRGGGVAQWKSLLFEGYVFIEFSIESLYLDLGPVDEKWKVGDVQSRPCNLYVIPIPHHSVGQYIVSLKATCGWIGKKPSHFPSPGTQLFPKIDLSSVHVTRLADIKDSKLEIDEVKVPLECYQNNDVNKAITSEGPIQSNLLQVFTVTNAKAKGNIIQRTQNGETSRINCNTQSQAPPLLPYEHLNTDKNKCGKIWEDKNKTRDHHQGTIFEVHSSVGQLKGVDGSLHYFSRENCYLYGVPLHNVELWHVLTQDDPVLYTVIELVPGMMKVQGVWLGALELTNNKTAADHIFDWCQMKLVPDGARDILVSQLEMQ